LVKKQHIFACIILSFIFLNVSAQISTGGSSGSSPRSKEKRSWIFGLGWNVVDDNGSPFKKLFDIPNAWSMPWHPSQLSAELIGKNGFTYGAAFSYNKYKSGKTINSKVISGSFLFFNLDLFAKYHLKEHVKLPPRIDPYASAGAGYTLRFVGPYNNTATLNFGFGMNVWLNQYIGLNLQSLAKFGLRSPFYKNGSNYLQHSIGVVFILDNTPKKRYSFIKARYPWVHRKPYSAERK
jgi:hypothetical protein